MDLLSVSVPSVKMQVSKVEVLAVQGGLGL